MGGDSQMTSTFTGWLPCRNVILSSEFQVVEYYKIIRMVVKGFVAKHRTMLRLYLLIDGIALMCKISRRKYWSSITTIK